MPGSKTNAIKPMQYNQCNKTNAKQSNAKQSNAVVFIDYP